MFEWTLAYPVHSLDQKLLIPAGETIGEEELRDLVASSRADQHTRYPLLEVGTVRRDLLAYLCETCCNTVFSSEDDIALVVGLMEQVQLSAEKIESVEYFKRNDPYTYGHILKVFAYSTLLSKDLVQNYVTMIREVSTSPLHDFGKICVPLEILRKEQPLTRDERRHLEHHTVAGYLLLSYYSRNADHVSARVARDHHERRTGSGYPRGIPLQDPMVEIVAVCDIYDALTSQRPYRPVSYDNRTALEEITRMAERQEVSWEVVRSLVAHNRKEKPHYSECDVSLEKRGNEPPLNRYGVIQP